MYCTVHVSDPSYFVNYFQGDLRPICCIVLLIKLATETCKRVMGAIQPSFRIRWVYHESTGRQLLSLATHPYQQMPQLQ